MFSDNWISFYAGRIIDDRLQLISTAAIFSGCSCCICLAPVDVLKILWSPCWVCFDSQVQWPMLAASSGSYLICIFGLCVSVTITVSLRCLFWIMVLEKKNLKRNAGCLSPCHSGSPFHFVLMLRLQTCKTQLFQFTRVHMNISFCFS